MKKTTPNPSRAGGFGKIPFYLSRLLIDEILLAEDDEMRTGVLTLLAEDQIIAEPSGAASIVPVLSRQPEFNGKNVVCVISGETLISNCCGKSCSI